MIIFSVIDLDNINDYYRVDLKCGRPGELGIDRETIKNESSLIPVSGKSEYLVFMKVDFMDIETILNHFENEWFDILPCQIHL